MEPLPNRFGCLRNVRAEVNIVELLSETVCKQAITRIWPQPKGATLVILEIPHTMLGLKQP